MLSGGTGKGGSGRAMGFNSSSGLRPHQRAKESDGSSPQERGGAGSTPVQLDVESRDFTRFPGAGRQISVSLLHSWKDPFSSFGH